MTRFLLKINGELHGPGGVCRPRAANEWDGREIMLKGGQVGAKTLFVEVKG